MNSFRYAPRYFSRNPWKTPSRFVDLSERSRGGDVQVRIVGRIPVISHGARRRAANGGALTVKESAVSFTVRRVRGSRHGTAPRGGHYPPTSRARKVP